MGCEARRDRGSGVATFRTRPPPLQCADAKLHGCGGTTHAESIGMIRIALLLATLSPLTACIGPSRTPGRLGGALVAMTGAALAYDGHTTDCGDLGCALGTGIQASFGTNLLIAGVVTLIINEVRCLPPAVEQ